MPSGTYNFSLTAQTLVESSLRQTGRFGSVDTIPAGDITNCLQALNIIIKGLVKNQKPLWCMQRLTVPLAAGTATYNLSTISGQTRPLRVLFAFLRDAAGNDTELAIVARDDYNQLGLKSSPGTPNQLYVDSQLTAVNATVYNVPADSLHTMYVDIQSQIQDVNVLADTLDFPQEAYHMLKWVLADEIALEYLTPQDIRLEISRKAMMAYEGFFSGEREEASTHFSPSNRGGV